jgi:hypothetical protein
VQRTADASLRQSGRAGRLAWVLKKASSNRAMLLEKKQTREDNRVSQIDKGGFRHDN